MWNETNLVILAKYEFKLATKSKNELRDDVKFI